MILVKNLFKKLNSNQYHKRLFIKIVIYKMKIKMKNKQNKMKHTNPRKDLEIKNKKREERLKQLIEHRKPYHLI